MVNIQKCSIIGCGFVGSSIAFALLQKGLFSEIILIDADEKKAEGEAMDLNHGIPFVPNVKVRAGDYSDIADCALIIITAGGNQKPNQTRLELVQQNSKIMKSIVTNVIEYNKEGLILVVSNPVDVLTYVALKTSGFESNRVLGSGTVLDTSRLKYLVGDHLGVDSKSIHAFIIGEHGDSELPVWSSANVSGIDLDHFSSSAGQYCSSSTLDEIFEEVKMSAYRIIERKGATYYAIALAVSRIAECIVKNAHAILPVSCYVDEHYGLNDICISIPAIVGNNGIQKVLDIPLNTEEKERLLSSAKTLKDVIDSLEI